MGRYCSYVHMSYFSTKNEPIQFTMRSPPFRLPPYACCTRRVIQRWTVKEGYLYVISNLTGLGNPLTTLSPETAGGVYFCLLVSIWSMTIAGAAMGTVGNFKCLATLAGWSEGVNVCTKTKMAMKVAASDDSLHPHFVFVFLSTREDTDALHTRERPLQTNTQTHTRGGGWSTPPVSSRGL